MLISTIVLQPYTLYYAAVYEKMMSAYMILIVRYQCFSPSQEQYQTVFEAVLTYLDSFDTYANFQNI